MPIKVFMSGSKSVATLAMLCVLLIAATIAASGNVSLPLDAHEVFVIQTTQEMHNRNDWITPYFNNQPRLNKPPLNYWLTGAVAWANGSLDNVQAWHGRFVSVFAALCLVVITFFTAVKLYNQNVAYIAVIMLVTSLGFFDYSHDARPDMLYSMLCMAGVTAFVFACKSGSSAQRLAYIHIMWIAYALATLSKGPHIPAIFITASLFFTRSTGLSWKEAAVFIRPFTGLILFMIIAAPWWLLVNQQLGGEGLQGSQLTGTLFAIQFSNFYKFYYFYRPLILILPWVVFIPHAILNFIQDKAHKDANRLMAMLIFMPAIVLSFGSQERWVYMLPSITPMIILLATSVNFLLGKIDNTVTFNRLILIFHFLLLVPVIIIAAVIYLSNGTDKSNLVFFIICLANLVFVFVWVVRHGRGSSIHQFILTGVSYAIFFTTMGITHTGWSKDRFEFYKLAKYAHEAAGNQPVYTININPDIYVYYTATGIHQVKNIEQAMKIYSNSENNRMFFIVRSRDIDSITTAMDYTVLHETSAPENNTLSLIQVGK